MIRTISSFQTYLLHLIIPSYIIKNGSFQCLVSARLSLTTRIVVIPRDANTRTAVLAPYSVPLVRSTKRTGYGGYRTKGVRILVRGTDVLLYTKYGEYGVLRAPYFWSTNFSTGTPILARGTESTEYQEYESSCQHPCPL